MKFEEVADELDLCELAVPGTSTWRERGATSCMVFEYARRHECTPLDTFGPEDRAILADVREHANDRILYVADELRPQLRLPATDRRTRKPLIW